MINFALKAENKGIIDTSKINVKVKEDLKKYKEEIEEKIEKTILDKATENAENKVKENDSEFANQVLVIYNKIPKKEKIKVERYL